MAMNSSFDLLSDTNSSLRLIRVAKASSMETVFLGLPVELACVADFFFTIPFHTILIAASWVSEKSYRFLYFSIPKDLATLQIR